MLRALDPGRHERLAQGVEDGRLDALVEILGHVDVVGPVLARSVTERDGIGMHDDEREMPRSAGRGVLGQPALLAAGRRRSAAARRIVNAGAAPIGALRWPRPRRCPRRSRTGAGVFSSARLALSARRLRDRLRGQSRAQAFEDPARRDRSRRPRRGSAFALRAHQARA